ncbi:MAG: BatA domain-containing protein [Lentisphaeria bacterium]|nr:BatA domain-containing protein [Lentisphaeria bacterium]
MKDFFFGFEHSALLWFALPAALVLLLLYLLHRRSKVRIVSAIFLWDRPQASPTSGTRIRFRLPPAIFYLELAVLLLLAAALAAPFVSTPETFPPLAVILDDSMSMQAKVPGGKSPLESGAAFLKRELRDLPDRRVLWIVAGESPVLASDSSGRTDFAPFWTGQAPSSDLAAAAALARRMARGCHLLIVTDRKPAFELAPDTTCFSEGAPLGNSAIVNARRTAGRILVEAANFSSLPQDAALVLEPGSLRTQLRLAPKETRRIVLAVPDAAAHDAVTVRLENADPSTNALLCDDEAVLEAEDDSPVSYRVAAGFPAAARSALERVLNGNPAFRQAFTGETPDLDILPAEAESPSPVHLYWLASPKKKATPADQAEATENPPQSVDNAPSADGPLSPENSADISRGLPLDSLQWAVSADDLPGQTLLRSGDVPALSTRQNLNRDREIFLNLDPARSNITHHPFWPVFFQNLAQTVRTERFGPARTNLRAGELLRVRLPRGAQSLTAVRPDGKSTEIRAMRGQADFRPMIHGEWRLGSGDAKWSVSVMGLSAEESDLSGAGPFRRDADSLAVMPFWMLRPLAWAFLLLAAALLAAHHLVLTRKGGGPC